MQAAFENTGKDGKATMNRLATIRASIKKQNVTVGRRFTATQASTIKILSPFAPKITSVNSD